MRKLALGKLGWSPQTFYTSRLIDLHDALAGFNELEEDRNTLQILQTRKIISWLVNVQLPRSDRVDEKEIWPLPIDKELEQKLLATLPKTEVILGKDE